MISPELKAKLEEYKAKQLAGTITIEELRDAVNIMREGRQAASVSSAGSITKRKTAAEKANINAEDLLSQLDDL